MSKSGLIGLITIPIAMAGMISVGHGINDYNYFDAKTMTREVYEQNTKDLLHLTLGTRAFLALMGFGIYQEDKYSLKKQAETYQKK